MSQLEKRAKKNQIYLTTKFDQNQPQKFQQKNNSSINHTKSRVSGALSQLSINSISSSQLKPNPQRSIKTNDVYRKPTENLSYLKPSNYKQHRPYQRQIQSQNENPYKVCKNSTYQYYEKDSPERKYGGNPEYSDYRNQNNNKYRYYEDDTFSRDEPDSQRKYQEDYIEEPYKNYYENSKTQEIKKRNQSRINLYQRQNSQNENNQSERYSQYSPNSQQHASFGKPSTKYAQQPVYTKGGDHSLTRIKNQIQKSRKLIQQFKKSQIPRF